jgi:hypothetical protein
MYYTLPFRFRRGSVQDPAIKAANLAAFEVIAKKLLLFRASDGLNRYSPEPGSVVLIYEPENPNLS